MILKSNFSNFGGTVLTDNARGYHWWFILNSCGY